MVIVNGTFQVKPECRQALIDMSLALVEPSKEEPGCILYSFLENAGKPGQFLFFEKWRSRKDLDEHFQKPYFLAFAEKFPGMIIGEAVIEVHEVAATELI